MSYPHLAIIYFVSIIAFVLYAADKHLAWAERRRIPEGVLLLVAFGGGAFGALCAMIFFHHKTAHRKFTLLIPLFLVIQLALAILCQIL